jgi:hypothetical protein
LGFIQGIRIHDAIGTVHKCLHSLKKKKTKSLVLDIGLRNIMIAIVGMRIILIQIGLGMDLREWIMICVMSTSYLVLINGEPTTFFKREWGLR